MDKGFSELREIFATYEARVRLLETTEAGCQPLINSRLEAAFRRIDEHTTEIKTLTESNHQLKALVIELQQSNKVLTWIGGLLGSALLLWVINQLMGLIK